MRHERVGSGTGWVGVTGFSDSGGEYRDPWGTGQCPRVSVAKGGTQRGRGGESRRVESRSIRRGTGRRRTTGC